MYSSTRSEASVGVSRSPRTPMRPLMPSSGRWGRRLLCVMWLDDDGEDRAVFWQLPCLQGPCYASSMGRAPRGALVRPIRSWFESRRSARPRPRPARREAEVTGGELAVVDQGGGVLVHAHGDDGVG